jgi:hypothetical protein
MKVVSFEDVKADGYDICLITGGCSGDADVIILDINSIFEYEEKKHDLCGDKWISVAIIDDPDDYEAFKNFGIDTWIKREDILKLNELLDIIKSKLGS